jgi:hypothetical protein
VAANKGTKPQLLRYQKAPDGSVINSLGKAADYVVGSGNHARTYLHRTPNGKLIELPLTWYSEKGGYWHMSPAYDRRITRGSAARSPTGACSAITVIRSFRRAPTSGIAPSSRPRCRKESIASAAMGRGGHMRSQAGGRRFESEAAGPDRQLEICMQCHLETTSSPLPAARLREGRGVFSYRPGEPLGNYAVHFDHAPGTGHDDKFEIVNAAYG